MSDKSLGPREVARAAGVSTDTLRHYERKGLLPRVQRTAAGYREYPAGTIERVVLIQRALVVGFTLEDLTRVLAIRDRGGVPCANVRTLVGERLEELERRIEELVTLRDELRVLLRRWDRTLATTAPGNRAHLLETLGDRARIDEARVKRRRLPALRAVRRSDSR